MVNPNAVAAPAAANARTRLLTIRWPWWLHPVWALVLMVGMTALVSIMLPAEYYGIWGTTKFINTEFSLKLLMGILLVLLGVVLANFRKARGGTAQIVVGQEGVVFLRKTYRILYSLTVVGYLFWSIIAISEGVRVTDLLAVMQRDDGAIHALKENSRPVGGLTTLTQFGPVAVVIGFILRKIGVGGRSYWGIIALAFVRAAFYAERLALLEVLLPLVLIATITMGRHSRLRPAAQIVPLLLGPLVWVVFALSEYSRSWVYYQHTVSMPFAQWVTSRLLGYYTTSYNNSALFADAWRGVYEAPYMSVQAFWNTPGITWLIGAPSVLGLHPNEWWSALLQARSNPEFNNRGSFLVTYAELGWVGASLFWLVVGYVLGSLFASITRGSLPGLVAYCALFVGLLELPRFIYWTTGRAVPVLLALLLLSLAYQKYQVKISRNNRGPSILQEARVSNLPKYTKL